MLYYSNLFYAKQHFGLGKKLLGMPLIWDHLSIWENWVSFPHVMGWDIGKVPKFSSLYFALIGG